MVFELSTKTLDRISCDVAVVFAFEGTNKYEPTESFSSLDSRLDKKLTSLAKAEKFTGKKNSVLHATFVGEILPTRIVVVGLGPRASFTGNVLRKSLAQLAKMFNKKIDSLSLTLLTEQESSLTADLQGYYMAEAFELGTYRFAHYQESAVTDRDFSTIILSVTDTKLQKAVQSGLSKGSMYAQATKVARDLVNEQAATATPEYMARFAKEIAKKSKTITCTVFDKAQLEKMGMHAFLGIARGAGDEIPPKFVFMEYKPTKATKKTSRKLAIVGKGITFDTGGINVKPEGYMTTMKQDMAGAAAMLAVFSVIDSIAPEFPVIGCAALTPNLISGRSIVPGDIVRAYNGKTIEVNHTDAEGRVTLADSLSYAVEQGATEIIDLATLTGACMVALGNDIAAIMSNNRDLVDRIRAAAYDAGEEAWELPLYEDYNDQNKSDVADISNLPASRWGGAITAGLFLQQFVNDTPWAHMDIAGPAFADKEHPMGPKGGTGYGVRLLLHYISAQGGKTK